MGGLSDGCNGHHMSKYIVPVGHVIPWRICSLDTRAVDIVYVCEALVALAEVDALCACAYACVCVCV